MWSVLDTFGPGQKLSLGDFLQDDVMRMAVLVRQYADLKLGGTDAAVIATAERLGITRVATVIRRAAELSCKSTSGCPRQP